MVRTRTVFGSTAILAVLWAATAWAADAAGTWTLMSTPNPGAEWDWLHGVSAVTATNVWAVGEYLDYEGGTTFGLIEHFDGSAWTVNFRKANAMFEGVESTSASNAWAVGYDLSGAAIFRYDGAAWSKQPSPSVPDGYLYGISASSPSDAWAVGVILSTPSRTLVEHWNGSSWKRIKLKDPGQAMNDLYGVAAISPTDVWAVGDYGDSFNGSKALMLHYDGTHWLRIRFKGGGCGSYLSSVSATSPTDVWAAGSYCPSDPTGTVLHYDGASWKRFAFPLTDGLLGIEAVSPSSAWAVGQATDTSSFAAHWNGSRWTRQATPGAGPGDLLAAVTAQSSSVAFTVGESIYDVHKIRTLALECCA